MLTIGYARADVCRRAMRLHRNDESISAPTLAVLIDSGYLTDWPHEWTRDGMRAIRRNLTEKRHFDGLAVLREALARIKRHNTSVGVTARW